MAGLFKRGQSLGRARRSWPPEVPLSHSVLPLDWPHVEDPPQRPQPLQADPRRWLAESELKAAARHLTFCTEAGKREPWALRYVSTKMERAVPLGLHYWEKHGSRVGRKWGMRKPEWEAWKERKKETAQSETSEIRLKKVADFIGGTKSDAWIVNCDKDSEVRLRLSAKVCHDWLVTSGHKEMGDMQARMFVP